MPKNVEFKARINNTNELVALAKSLCDGTDATLLSQCDTFFNANHGRLKIREFGSEQAENPVAELIFYDRPDEAGPKVSDFVKVNFCDSAQVEELKEALDKAMGTRGVLKKERLLFLPQPNIRIHVDKVEGLGDFVEIEVCLVDEMTSAQGEDIARNLLKTLCIDNADLISGAYIDALENCQ